MFFLHQDKTFGLKNKKGAKGQKFVKLVATQVTYGNNKTAKQVSFRPPKIKRSWLMA